MANNQKIPLIVDAFVNWPASPDKELISMNNDVAVVMFFALSTLINNNIGLKKNTNHQFQLHQTQIQWMHQLIPTTFLVSFYKLQFFDQKIEISEEVELLLVSRRQKVKFQKILYLLIMIHLWMQVE